MLIQLDSDEAVDQFIGEGGRLLYFTADWCRPCKFYAPRIEKASTETDKHIGKINADFANGAVLKYGVRSIPTIIKLDLNGNIQKFETGVKDVEFIKSFVS